MKNTEDFDVPRIKFVDDAIGKFLQHASPKGIIEKGITNFHSWILTWSLFDFSQASVKLPIKALGCLCTSFGIIGKHLGDVSFGVFV